jgi:hypothetical protein
MIKPAPRIDTSIWRNWPTNGCVITGQWDFLDEERFPCFGASRASRRNPVGGRFMPGTQLYGYIAMILGIVFSLAIGCGLMALMFDSSRHGYDEPPDCR